jgi:hypothetical protein
MKRCLGILIGGLLTFFYTPSAAQFENEVRQTIETFFEGMKAGDTSLISTTLAADVDLKSIYNDSKTGETQITVEKMDSFLDQISKKPEEVIYDERLLSFDIKIDGSMALAWTPYRFYLNEKFSHCGVNVFTLARISNIWRIVSITDTRRRADCEPD